MRPSVILYNDAPSFGGHEVMSIQLAGALARDADVTYFHSQEEMAGQLPASVKSVGLPFASTVAPLAVLRNLNPRHVGWLARQFEARHPVAVVIVHGSISLGLRGALAARRLGVRTISYLPMSFPHSLMGLRAGALHDRYAAVYYRLFDAFITINASQQAFIRKFARPGTPVNVLENCIPEASQHVPYRAVVSGPTRVGLVGRLEWRQKGLDCFVEVARAAVARREDLRFVIVGDGPHRHELECALRAAGLEGRVEWPGWVTERDRIYDSFDILLSTSMFEGVPLVMLEALLRRIPVLARLTPGTGVFAEYLPDFCLFRDPAEAADRLAAFETLNARFAEIAERLARQIGERHGVDTFAARVNQIFAPWLERPGPEPVRTADFPLRGRITRRITRSESGTSKRQRKTANGRED